MSIIRKTPFVALCSLKMIFRTGDWGLLKSDQDLEICGRCDSMVKIRGYSIEIQVRFFTTFTMFQTAD